MTYRSKRCDYNNKNEVNSPNIRSNMIIINDNNQLLAHSYMVSTTPI